MSNPKILDLDKLVPEQRIVRLAGEEIDVSKIPSRVTMEVAEKADMFDGQNAESFDVLLDMIIKICKPSKPDITKDWIIDNTEMNQLIALIQFVIEPLQEKVNETQGVTEANEPKGSTSEKN